MASPLTDIISAAEAEWKHWGKSTWNCVTGKTSKGYFIDDDDEYAQYVIDTYLPAFFKVPIKWPSAMEISDDQYAWSAVTISHFFKKGGLKIKPLADSKSTAAQYASWVKSTDKSEFPIAQAHSEYIRWAIRCRKDALSNAAYWGYRVDEPEATPEVGDLIGYPRGVKMTAKKALGYFERTGNYQSHADLVVAKRKGEIDVIGGNVRDSVTKKTLAIDDGGLLVDKKHHWFVVLKCRL